MPTNEYQIWLQEIGESYRLQPIDDADRVFTSMPKHLHQSHWCTTKAISFMKECQHFDQPWLFSINYFDPHHPFDPPQEFLERHLRHLSDIPLPKCSDSNDMKQPMYQEIDSRRAVMDDTSHRMCTAAYWAMVENIDYNIGRLLTYLETSGQIENTIIIFMSDHGEMLGDHGVYYKGAHLVDSLVRVPLIISYPALCPQGERRKALVELVDIAPTVLDLCGITIPEYMQGKSLRSLMTQQSDHHKDTVYCEFHNAMSCYHPKTPFLTMIRNTTFKLIITHGEDQGELYDLTNDPWELQNVWDDEGYGSHKLEMLHTMVDTMAFTADPYPVRESEW